MSHGDDSRVMVPEAVEQFMTALATNRLEDVQHVLAEDVSVAFSTVGVAQGRAGVVALIEALRPDFDVASTVMTNLMEANDSRFYYYYGTAHHLQGYRDGNVLFAIPFGGKYAFAIDRASGRIHSVRFDLEYVTGNTYWARDRWDTGITSGHDRLISGRLLRPSPTDELGPVAVANRLLWAVDVGDAELLRACGSDSIRWNRRRTGSTTEAFNTVHELAAHARRDGALRVIPPLSVVFNPDPVRDQTSVRLVGRRLNPGHTGNKHRGGHTTHALFFDQDVTVELERTEDGWRVTVVDLSPKEGPEFRAPRFMAI